MNASLPQNQAFRPGWLKSCTLALTTLLVAGLSWSAEAQTTLYNYTNATSGSPASVAAGLAGTNLSRGAGVDTTINCAANQGFGSDGWPTTNTFDVDMFNGSGDYIEFTLDPNVGSTLLISGFTANSRRENPSGTNNDGPASLRYAYSKTGAPGSWTFVNPGNPQASSTCGSLGVTRVWTSFPSVSVSGSETITFRIYGLSSGANMTGDLFLRNIAVSGYVCTSTPTASLTPVSFCEGTDAYDIPVASSTADITSYSLSFSPAGIPSVSGTLPSPGALPSVLTIAADMAGDGVYSGTLTLTNACGSNTVIYFPDLVTINPLPVVNITIAEESGVADDDGTVCPGDEATITASGGGTYLWSTSETTASVTVSPATNTIYDVTVTNLGCEQTASATILVTAPETADAGPDQSTCINGTVLLAGSFGGTATGASWSDNGAGGSFLPNASTLNAYYIPPVNNTDPITLTLSTDGPCPVSDEVIISYDAEPAMTLSANASSSTATCNDQVTVTIEVEEGYNDLSSLQFSINWNASAFSLVSHSATAVGGSTPSTSTPGMGVLTYSWFDMMGDFGEDLPDGTVLLTMTFDILNASGLESIDIANSPTIIEGVTWQQCELDITLNNDADINLEPITIGLSIEEESGIADNDGNICAGDDVTLTASGGVSYEWSPGGETTESITVSPTSSTTYTVTVTDSNGCTNSATAEIRVNPLPMAAVTVDLNEICIGGAIEITFYEGVYPDGTEFILSANIEDANGPNPNNPISYSEVIDTDHIDWTEGFDFSGDLSVSDITVTNPATGCSSVVDGFEVDVLDAPVLSFTAQADGDDPQSGGSNGPTTVTLEFCEGDFFSFTAYNVNDPRVGVLEELDGTGNVTAGGPPAVVVPRPQTDITPASVDGFFNGGPYGPYGLESGTYGQFVQTFTPYLDIDGVPGYSAGDCLGETVTLVYNVHANPTPSIDVTETSGGADDDSAICLGASVTLTASGGNTYLWSTMATTASITVSPTTTTTYTVTVTNADGCLASVTQIITVNGLPTVGIMPSSITICSGSETELTATAGGSSYLWSTMESTASISVTPTTNTTYTVTLTDNNGCTNTATSEVNIAPDPLTDVTVDPDPICAGSTAVLTANGAMPDATFTWYDAPTGGNVVGTGNPFTTDPLYVTTEFCVEQTVVISAEGTMTFDFTGGMQTFTVPDGITSIEIQAYGAQGGNGNGGSGGAVGGTGGLGGLVQGTLAVTPGQVLNLFVGGAGMGPVGGYNGGANGGTQDSGGGGGATDIRIGGTADSDRVLTAGGGGGGGRGGCHEGGLTGGNGGNGGNGGGGIGADGADTPTSGGVAGGGKGGNFSNVQGAFGAAGLGCAGFLGNPGSATATSIGGVGGGGQACCCFSGGFTTPGGGGGGGGHIGGGGAGGGSAGTTGCSGNSKGAGGGGGGGSSYTGSLSDAVAMNGVRSGNGQIIITYGLTCTSPRVCGTVNVTPLPMATIAVTETSGAADDGTICAGASVTLTASGGETYLWSTMATTASITVSPTTTTTYTVTVTDNDCSTSISSVINVTPMPSLNATLNGVSVSNNNDGQDDTGAFAICNGSNITFDAFADANGASGNIKAYQTVSLSNVSLSFCNNCAALVTAFPGVNGAATLVNPALPGTVTLSFRVFNDLNNNNAIDADECPNDWVVYTITVNPIPVPAIAVTENSGTTPNDGAICEGASATLTASGGDTYLWSPGGATTSSITVSPTSTTTYTVTVTSNNCSTSTSSVITVNPLPAVSLVLDPNEACVTDDGFALDGGIPTGGTYSGAGIMTSPTFEPAGAQAGVHTITYTYTDANGCVNTATDDITVYELLINSYAPASQAQTICDGENTSFRVNFTSTPDVTVSATWQIWDGDSWEPLTIAAPYSTTLNNTQNFARLNITAASYLLSGAQYRVVLNNGACETISDPFTLTVNGPVSIDEQPESVTICGSEVDQEATFTAVVTNPSGTTNLRWQYFDGTNWVNTGGAGTFGNTTNTLTVNDNWAHWPAPGSSVQLRLRAQTPGCPAIFSDVVTLSVNFDIDPLITGPLYVNSMAAVSFFGAPGITPPATFAGGTWAVSGGPGTVSVDFADDYNFVVTGDLPGTVTITYQSTDDAGCTGTDQVTLTVLDKLTLSAIPSDLTVSCGEEITVNIEADNLVELIEMAYNLTWDPSELAYVSSSGTQLGDALPVIDATNAATGLLYYYWGGEYTGMPLNDHVLLSITFTVLQNSGSAGIFFDSPVATNTSISNVPINTNDGVMSVTPILIVLDNPDPVCPVDCDDAQGQIVTYGITTTGNPDQYSLIWGMAAAGAGFAEVNNAVFDISNGEFTVVIPCGLEGGTYGGTLTVTDSETGCTGTTSIAVVIDDQPPVITECPASVTVSCESSDDFPDADPDGVVAEDACGPLTVDVNEANNEGGGCVGDPLILTRTYTVTDPAGNSTNCIQTITMIDEDGPVLAGNAPEFEGDCFDSEEEAVEAVRDYVLAYITDECHANGIEVEDLEDIAVIYDEFDCSVTIQVGAIDGCTPGNASTFEFGGIIIDGTAPTLTLTDIDDCYETIADALAAAVDPMFTTVDDDCPGTVDVTAEIDDINSLCAAMIIVTATDACGNVTTGSYGPVRIDGTSPVIENEDPLLLANTCFETFEEAAAAAEAAIEAGDNCVGELIIGTDELAPDAECPYTLTVRVTDECGNFSLYQFTGVKIDNTPPVPVFDEPEGPLCYRDPEDAKADLLLQVDWEDDCGFPVMYETAEYSNETDPNPNDECEFGVVTITAVDLCGQSFSIDIDVKIDATPPYVIDQNGLPVLTGDCIGEVPADVDAIAMLIADNCDQGFDLVFDGDELSEEDGCVIIRSYTATDACGLSATFTQRIEISDEEAPVWGDEETNNPDLLLISCSAGTEEISLEDLIQSALNQDPPAVTDNCEGEDEDVAYITVSVETFDPVADPECPNGYSITKIWTAVDQCGNASTYTRIVQVTDNEAPGFDPFCQFMPLNIYTAEGYACPEDAEISLEVGQEIDNATTWTVAGYPVPALGSCIFDNCSDASNIVVTVEAIDMGDDDETLPCTRTITVTFSLTDECGNTQEDPFICVYNIIDNTSPTWETEEGELDRVVDCNIPSELNDALALAPVPVDNCDDEPLISLPDVVDAAGDCEGEYTITRTWIASDHCYNSNSPVFTQTIHVIDNDPPTFNPACQFMPLEILTSDGYDCPADAEITLTVGQELNINSTWNVAGYPVASLAGCISDACSAPESIKITVESILDATDAETCNRTITVSFRLEDACGNVQPQLFVCIYEIIDDTEPVFDEESIDAIADCYDSIDDAVEAALDAATPHASDNCTEPLTNDNFTFTVSSNEEDCTVTINVYVTDCAGNSDVVTFNTKVDNEPPTLIANCSALAPSYPTATAAQTALQLATSYEDNCPGPFSIVNAFTVGTCDAIVTLVYADACGNTSTVSCATSINSSPLTLICPAPVTRNTDAGECNYTVTANDLFAPTISGGCSPYAVSYVLSGATTGSGTGTSLAGIDFNKGTTVISWTVSDDNNATTACSVSVTVVDTQSPTIACPANITKGADNNQCSAVTTYAVTASDNCMFTVTQTAGLPSGSAFPVGTTVNGFQVVDMSGNSANCSFNVTVNDTQLPTIACPANIVTSTTTGQCSAVVNYTVTASDNCGGTLTPVLISGPASGSTFPLGTTGPIQWRATDGAGNSANCSFSVTVNDTQAPDIVCPANITVPAMGGGCSATVNYNVTATDNCGGTITPTLVSGGASGSTFTGTSTVVWSATDAAQNMATCSFTVSVSDGQAPTISCPVAGAVTRSTNVNDCFYTVVGNEFNATGSDNCGAPTITYAVSGATTGTGTSLAGVGLNKGTNTIVWTATDAGGNTAICSFTVQVNDTRPPVVSCPPSQTVNAAANACGATVNPGTLGATDNCGAPSTTFGPIPNANFFPIGMTTLTGTATDNSGNTAMCTTKITVIDNSAPVFTKCPANLTLNNIEGGCTGNYTGIDSPEATDNCAFTLTWTTSGAGATPGSGSGPIPGSTVFNSGTTTVTYVATDASGNTAVCSYTVTVVCVKIKGTIVWEHDPPVIGVKNATVTLMGTSPAITLTTTTDTTGMYMFSIPGGNSSIMVEPTKPALNNAQKLDGVTIADAQAITNHLNNMAPITDPYKLIAADVNSTNTVTTVDASTISSALLGNPLALAAFEPSWKFINANTVLPNPPASPFALYNANKKITITGPVNTDQLSVNFIGIKSGNVNGSPAPVFAPSSPLIWLVEDRTTQAGQEFDVTFSAVQFNELSAYQFAIDFDPTQLQLIDIQPMNALSLSAADNFGAFQAETGELRAGWFNASNVTLGAGTPVFKVRFKALTSGAQLSNLIQLNDAILPGKAFNTALVESPVVLSFSDLNTSSTNTAQTNSRLQLLQNRPNPFNEETTIGFVLPEACEASLRIYDLSGREITSHSRYYSAGYHEVMFRVTNASDYGIMFYELTTPSGRLVRKMISTGK
ncbi:MAG: HYR domain-containing protein [Saprospiraceae bacterium]|nr:HYR domain-containing protein [Saprospiraceae bacterium]